MTDVRALTDLVAAVRPGLVDADPTAVLAAGAWTTLIEPGDRVAGALVDVLGPAEALDALRLDAPPTPNPELRRAFDRWAPRFEEASFVRAFRDAARIGARLLVPGDADWPAGLADLAEHGPLALWALAPSGPVRRFERSVALVGSRSATPYGERVTADAACGLADRGFAVVSGAAMGIDGVAHRAVLASSGLTVAVLAGGLDRFYPAQHTELLHRVAVEGVVLSEMPCGARPMRERFLKRNRLIAALSRATVVVEAGLRSGAANTAAHAAELGRGLGAVPGSVYSAASAGTHRLVREYGAVLVRDAADMAELAQDPDGAVTLDGLERIPAGVDPDETRVLGLLSARPKPVREVAAKAGLSIADASAALGMLSLTGAAVERAGGWSRARSRLTGPSAADRAVRTAGSAAEGPARRRGARGGVSGAR
ncbi:DNA-processing protein DprA [Amnibacterium kyonggiense]|uniref:DNA protecting protein DprA n=1 Tax=Amnibacterium kyonggiense TaxID=595671 RepID=A0A4R7FT33_9MICO|nr:DNA-processing protein DprA [Amnibacterium kyonggiense]TDS80966.1 DNA protecting protein DprA [Amnibacterium kyonggiense]